MITYFVVQTFSHTPRGAIIADEAFQVPSRNAAERTAARCAESKPAVVAFSRTGDPSSGDFDDAVIIASYGVIPWEEHEMAMAV